MVKRQLVPLEILSEDSQKFFNFLNASSDLGAILVAASYLDASLAGLLHKFLIESTISDKLLAVRGPLGTLVARADAAYALGLISKGMYKCLITIAEIRNECAHHHLELTFEDPKIKEHCEGLNYLKVLFNDLGPLEQFTKTARARFTLSASLLSQNIIILGLGAKRREESRAFMAPEPTMAAAGAVQTEGQ
jgi:DNA-binding MltR family transcriptional regulator